jgi:ATP dependent DNA ligase-like protein
MLPPLEGAGQEGVKGLRPPVALALARDERQVPEPNPLLSYEPKFDGWRAALWTQDGFVQSRRDNNLARRFPEIVDAGRQLGDVVLDGELVALREGKLDFGALASSPGVRAGLGVTIYYIAFDLVAAEDRDWRPEPYRRRRARLEELFTGVAPPLQLSPSTTDQDEALQWLDPSSALVGIEGVLVKARDQPYRAGRTGDWRKIRHTVVVDAVVIGVTGPLVRPEAVVLARPDQAGVLRPIGLSLPLPPSFRDLVAEYVSSTGEPLRRLPGAILGHPGTEYQPVHPHLVVEAEAEPTVATFSARLRPRVHRIRPDLTPDDHSHT